MEEKINNASLSFTCNENWDKMKPDGEARFCGTCQKKVYDLTDKKAAYFIQIMQENNHNVCGRFTNDQLAVVPQTNESHWQRWAVAALLFVGFGTAAQEADAQTAVQGRVALKTIEPDRPIATMGIVIPMVVNPDLVSLHNYLVQNCIVPASANGRLIVSFKLKKDGSLTELAVSNHLSSQVRQEVLRVLKTAPKWKKTNREYSSPYSLDLTFKNGKLEPGRH